VGEKSIRTIVIFGVMGTLVLTLMMMFTLSQVTDTQTPQIAQDVSKDLSKALAPTPPANVKLTMTRDGKGLSAPRLYKLTLRPSETIASQDRAISQLMQRASECVAAEIGDVKCPVTIECVAELPNGGTREARFEKDDVKDPFGFGSVHAVATATPSAVRDPVAPPKVEKR